MIDLRTPVASFTATAIMRDRSATRALTRIAARIERRTRPNPGGAARPIESVVELAGGDILEIGLGSMRDGGGARIVHRHGSASLHGGRILRVPAAALPAVVAAAMPGRSLGEVVDLAASVFAPMASARITDVFETHERDALLIHTDAPAVGTIPIST